MVNVIDSVISGTAGAPIDPLLGPLADNGGQTMTHALLPASPAIGAGNLNAVGGIVSDDPESRERDLAIKRAEYAAAGISEYWIVDPIGRQITVLTRRSE